MTLPSPWSLATALLASAAFLAAPSRAQSAATASGGQVAGSSETPTLTFRKIFKSSYPEYTEIKVNQDGAGSWDIRQLDEAAAPQPFEVSPSLAQKLFELADGLHDFAGVDLDVHRRIANLGQKTFRYEKGGEIHEVTFNYTLNSTANQLLALFEGLARQQLDQSDLERTMRYDHLGVNDALLRLQSDIKNRLLPEPGRLLPVLDQVAADSDLLDISRERARAIAERIRNGH